MKLIWTKSNAILSRFIRWGLKTDCSHFAIVFRSPAGGLMFESNLLGTHPKFFRTALKHMEIVHERDLLMTVENEDALWDIIVDEYDDQSYDFKAFFYFCWRGLLWRLLKIPFPSYGKWNSPHASLCVKIYKALIEMKAMPPNDLDLTITSPHQLFMTVEEENNG